jgi:hypothetical protein
VVYIWLLLLVADQFWSWSSTTTVVHEAATAAAVEIR